MRKLLSVMFVLAAFCVSLSFGMVSADAATIKGDVNGDNNITLRDATLVQKINAKSLSPTSNQSYSADFDSSNNVELVDALLIQKFICLDKATLNEYSPNRSERINFLNALNTDRVAAGLAPIEYNDAMLEAGNIRAKEFASNGSSIRPNSQSFVTIFAECNLNVGSGSSPMEKTGNDISDGTKLYKIYKQANSPVYQYMMSSDCTIVCVGSVPSSAGSRTAAWVIVVA